MGQQPGIHQEAWELLSTLGVQGSQNSETNATPIAILSSTSVQQFLVPNIYRRSATFYNDSIYILYLGLGSTPSISPPSYYVKIYPQGFYKEQLPIFLGAFYGVWVNADPNGFCMVNELE